MGVAGHFVSAYNSSLMFARAQTKVPDCQPSKLVLMGSGSLLKGLPEVRDAANPLPAAEMALVRLAYAADLPPTEQLVRHLRDGEASPAPAPSSASAPR